MADHAEYEDAAELQAERDALRTKITAIREIAAEPVNKFETPHLRLAMIVRLCDQGGTRE